MFNYSLIVVCSGSGIKSAAFRFRQQLMMREETGYREK